MGWMAEVRTGLRRAVASAGRHWLLAVMIVVGGTVAGLVVAAAPVPTIAEVAMPVQLVVSVLVPLSGVLLAHDLTHHRDGELRRPGAVVIAGGLYAAGVALLTFLACLIAVVVHPAAQLGSGRAVAAVAGGSVGVQVTAQLVGTGLGFLVRSNWLAFLGTIVVPLGWWLLLGVFGPVAWLRGWLTPFGAAPPLLTGTTTVLELLRWVVVVALWGGLLNVVGAHRLTRLDPQPPL